MCKKIRKFKMLKTLSYISFICALELSSCYESKDGNNSTINKNLPEGSPCEQLGLVGNCTRVSRCEVALDAVMRGKRHELLRCGFIGKEEVVCCPDLAERNQRIETSTLDTSVVWSGGGEKPKTNNGKTPSGNTGGRIKTKRKCEIMCEKIYRDNNIKTEIEYHVLNGEDAKVGQFPHMAALGYLDDDGNIDWKRCAGSLISARFLLTAAHCILCVGCSDPVKVRFGVVDLTDDQSAQDVDVEETMFSENYDITSRHNDIALVKLKKDVRMSKKIYPACLYTEANDPIGLRVSGWGQVEAKNLQSRSDILQFAPIEAVPTEQCNTTILTKNKFTSKIILNTQICAISKSDTCAGDSGGPLQVLKKQGGYDIVGIVSYGIQCGTSIPGIYTRVSAYLDWVEEKVWPT